MLVMKETNGEGEESGRHRKTYIMPERDAFKPCQQSHLLLTLSCPKLLVGPRASWHECGSVSGSVSGSVNGSVLHQHLSSGSALDRPSGVRTLFASLLVSDEPIPPRTKAAGFKRHSHGQLCGDNVNLWYRERLRTVKDSSGLNKAESPRHILVADAVPVYISFKVMRRIVIPQSLHSIFPILGVPST